MILVPGSEFFSAKCAQFSVISTKLNYMKDIFSRELLSLIFEINLIKSHVNSALIK